MSKATIIIEHDGKRYRPVKTKHPCRDRRSCSLFARGVCDFDGDVDSLPCDRIHDALQRAGMTVGMDVCFKEVTK